MNRIKRRTYSICLIVISIVITSCGGKSFLLKRAKQGAEVSHNVYEFITPQVVEQIEGIVEKDRARTITESDREKLRSLNEFKKILDDYSSTHNLFVEALKTWEQTEKEPDNVVLLENQVLRLINRALDMAGEFGMQIPAGLR